MRYRVEYSLTVEVEAEDAVEAWEKADEIAKLEDATCISTEIWSRSNSVVIRSKIAETVVLQSVQAPVIV